MKTALEGPCLSISLRAMSIYFIFPDRVEAKSHREGHDRLARSDDDRLWSQISFKLHFVPSVLCPGYLGVDSYIDKNSSSSVKYKEFHGNHASYMRSWLCYGRGTDT